jgi:regulator of replication initiation timing
MDTLEKRMDGLSNEVDTYRQRCSYLEQQNSALQQQLQKLQAQLSNNNKSNSSLSPSKTSVINQVKKEFVEVLATIQKIFNTIFCLGIVYIYTLQSSHRPPPQKKKGFSTKFVIIFLKLKSY